MDEIETDLTRGSIGGARSVCAVMSRNAALSKDQRAALRYAEAILFDVCEQMDSVERENDPQVIPIPEEALNAESAGAIAEWAHGFAEDQE